MSQKVVWMLLMLFGMFDLRRRQASRRDSREFCFENVLLYVWFVCWLCDECTRTIKCEPSAFTHFLHRSFALKLLCFGSNKFGDQRRRRKKETLVWNLITVKVLSLQDERDNERSSLGTVCRTTNYSGYEREHETSYIQVWVSKQEGGRENRSVSFSLPSCFRWTQREGDSESESDDFSSQWWVMRQRS